MQECKQKRSKNYNTDEGCFLRLGQHLGWCRPRVNAQITPVLGDCSTTKRHFLSEFKTAEEPEASVKFQRTTRRYTREQWYSTRGTRTPGVREDILGGTENTFVPLLIFI
jgi:hypothetical protein